MMSSLWAMGLLAMLATHVEPTQSEHKLLRVLVFGTTVGGFSWRKVVINAAPMMSS